eukprot:scaffold13014_cov57-Attheya_sp.AAC.5
MHRHVKVLHSMTLQCGVDTRIREDSWQNRYNDDDNVWKLLYIMPKYLPNRMNKFVGYGNEQSVEHDNRHLGTFGNCSTSTRRQDPKG